VTRRYFIGSDNSGHEYLVPVELRAEWSAWQELDEDDERSWTVPGECQRIEGTLTFTDPQMC